MNSRFRPLGTMIGVAALSLLSVADAQSEPLPLERAESLDIHFRIVAEITSPEWPSDLLEVGMLDLAEATEATVSIRDTQRARDNHVGEHCRFTVEAEVSDQRGLPSQVFYLGSLVGSPERHWEAKYISGQGLVGFDTRSSPAQVRIQWERESTEALVGLVRLLTWSLGGDLTESEPAEPWDSSHWFPLWIPSVCEVTFESEEDSADSPITVRRIIRTSPGLGIDVLEQCVAVWEVNAQDGEIEREQCRFQIDVQGVMEQRITGGWEAIYDWQFPSPSPDEP